MSVVISTLERTESLRRTLVALRYQRHPAFEVIVVDGPARDDRTEREVLELGLGVRYLRCPQENISRSRNVGIEAAAGEIVAFVDDDALPEPDWLEQLMAAYTSADVAGAGGIVYDHTGTRVQYRYSLSDRTGATRYDCDRISAAALAPGADPFLYLQGTNMSFRRAALVQIGGFDEQIEYNFDEAEVCLCLIDRGHRLRPLATAAVHHETLASRVRGPQRVLTDPYSVIKNRAYFALRYGTRSRSAETVIETVRGYAEQLRQSARAALAAGQLGQGDCERFLDRVGAGLERGIEVGLDGHRCRQSVMLSPRDPGAYRPFLRFEPPGGRRRACFLAAEVPAAATDTASDGHDIHVLWPVASDEPRRLGFDAGVWRHRFPVYDRRITELDGHAAAGELYARAATWLELAELARDSPVDDIWGPSGRTSLQRLRTELAQAIDSKLPPRSSSHAPLLERLLDRSTYPLDRLAEAQFAWSARPDEFVRAVYRAVLDRSPGPDEIALWTPGAARPGWRLELLEAVGRSSEARLQQTPLEWIDQLRHRGSSEREKPAPSRPALVRWGRALRATAAPRWGREDP